MRTENVPNQLPLHHATRSGERPRRLFLDFTHVPPRSERSGTARAAYMYLEHGYALARRMELEVIPAFVREGGTLIDARPALGESNLRRFRAEPRVESAYELLRSGVYRGLDFARLAAITAATPAFVAGTSLFSYPGFELWRGQLTRSFHALVDRAEEGVQRVLGRTLRFDPGDVLFLPAHWEETAPRHYRQLQQQGLRICPLVHDLFPVSHAEDYPAGWREQFRDFLLETVRSADHVFYVSNTVRSELEALARARRMQLPESSVLPYGRDAVRRRDKQPRTPFVRDLVEQKRAFFLMVGSVERRRNHLRVIQELEALWNRGVQVDLVIVGREMPNAPELAEAIRRKQDVHAPLHWLEDVSDSELWFLYRNATALIHAADSGRSALPMIEALSIGTRVLANDLPVFREVTSPAVSFFELGREGQLGSLLERVLGEPHQMPEFSWPTWRGRTETLMRAITAKFGGVTLDSAPARHADMHAVSA